MKPPFITDRGRTVFLLSPARTTGKKASQLISPNAKFELALRLQRGESVPIGEIFRFLSGLYFRGKLAYAECFAGRDQAFVITSNQGLLPLYTPLSLAEFQTFAGSEIDPRNESYRRPLEIDLARLASQKKDVILLGSIASPKYTSILKPFFPGHLYVPKVFNGMGDMSRGALLLRQVAEKKELEYVALA